MASHFRFASQPRVALPGSEKAPFSPETNVALQSHAQGKLPAAQAAEPAQGFADISAGQMPPAPVEPVTVTVVVKPKAPLDAAKLADPAERLTREEYAARHGADPEAVKTVKEFAAEFHLQVEPGPGPGQRSIHLSGSQKAMEEAFGVKLHHHATPGGTFRVRAGAIHVPQELAEYVVAVLGLDNRPQAQPHARAARPRAGSTSFTPVQVARLYDYPANAKATGQTIGLIELGGGFRTADITAYFKTLNMPAPSVVAVLVDKGKNAPGDANGADGEVMLDIEVCAAVAPGANVAVYFAPNTDQGFLDAVTTAVHDTKNKPSVISISWGGPESSWTAQAMTAFDQACQAAAAVGVTITAAAGDDGSTDGVASGNHVDFPASSPHVLACGGTKLAGSGTTITSEVVWNELAANEGATGGGVSTIFALPDWQKNASVPKPAGKTGGRGVPDVAGDADPATGYSIRVDGQTGVIGGTSAVAPLWAGLIALANAQNKKTAGFINPVLYAAGAKSAFRDITSGNNGAFKAGTGWDACTGLGTPVGSKVIQVLKGTAVA